MSIRLGINMVIEEPLAPDDLAGSSRSRSRRARLRRFCICFDPPLCSSGTASYASLGVRPCLICEPRWKRHVTGVGRSCVPASPLAVAGAPRGEQTHQLNGHGHVLAGLGWHGAVHHAGEAPEQQRSQRWIRELICVQGAQKCFGRKRPSTIGICILRHGGTSDVHQ